MHAQNPKIRQYIQDVGSSGKSLLVKISRGKRTEFLNNDKRRGWLNVLEKIEIFWKLRFSPETPNLKIGETPWNLIDDLKQ